MSLFKRLSRTRAAQEGAGFLFARYLDLVRGTNRFVYEPANLYDELAPLQPFIGAMWHGQHFMAPYMRRPQDRAASLVSRSSDGELNAIALRHLGIRAIRGSGARGRDQRAKGGAPALRAMLRALDDGENMFLTADIPKIARQCGTGIVLLARMSGRPVVPVAVATSRRREFRSWDRASLGLPGGRGAIVAGELIWVPGDADEAVLEAKRQEVERELDRVNARAFALVGRTDPGAGLRDLSAAPANPPLEPEP
jgi:lysophospholipid acyltransferase (LPLAT)-like uncharacterized protein